MIDPGSFLVGMCSAFAISAFLVGLCIWWNEHCKRLKEYERFENVEADYVETKMYCPPAYHVRIVKK